MKYSLILGGGAGFVLAYAASLHAGNSLTCSLRDGAIGCAAGTFLLGAWHRAFLGVLKSHLTERAATLPSIPSGTTPPSHP